MKRVALVLLLGTLACQGAHHTTDPCAGFVQVADVGCPGSVACHDWNKTGPDVFEKWPIPDSEVQRLHLCFPITDPLPAPCNECFYDCPDGQNRTPCGT